ncbi:MAG: DNA-directed DNA polymerase II small subunit [Candidatus Bathyarchaeota archaeon]|nr:MAG: DNA-directed DNA polymerase II small subunit [Candidatus Bathyarchaeota archaeon]
MSDRLQRAVSFTIAAGYQLDKQAFDFLNTLSQTEDPVRLMEQVIKEIKNLPQKTLFIQRSFLEEVAEKTLPEVKEEKPSLPTLPSPIPEAKKVFHAYAKDIDADIKVIEDPTDEICETGSIEEYLEYFQDRFQRIQRFLRRRMDVKDATSISEALKSSANTKVKIIGMITEKRERKQRVFLTVEDLEASATVLVSPSTSQEVIKKAHTLVLDQVVCINAIKGRNDLLIAEDIVWPDMPKRKPNKASIPVYAALISDLHIGSKMFMREEFSRFVLWLNGKFGNENLKNLASHVKYVVIAGDLVDGIGVYPGQLDELAITDIYEQYGMVSKFIEQIPGYIELIIIPGNHDASRKALPQPALPKDYAEPLYEARKVYSLGNPSTVRLHEVELLLYHGRSLDDIVASIPNVSFQTPDNAMKFLLQSRHLAPVYGKKTPIAPEKKDFMIIESPPDIFHAGHVHVIKCDTYRGTLIVNSGSWQKQTEFQKKMGVTPNPGIVPIVNLQTLHVTPINFAASYA